MVVNLRSRPLTWLRNGLSRVRGNPQARFLGEGTPGDGVPLPDFTPDAAYTWLIAHINPDCPEVAWGLCDVGLSHPGTGPVYLSGIAMVRGRLGLRVERDLHFTARKPLSAYARDAQQAGMIVTG